MTIEQAAEYLQLPKNTLAAWVREGLVPAVKIGRLWRFSRRQLLAWVEALASDEEEDRLLAEATQRAYEDPDNQERFTLDEVKASLGR
jgi:excisionase family DNA binding protein